MKPLFRHLRYALAFAILASCLLVNPAAAASDDIVPGTTTGTIIVKVTNPDGSGNTTAYGNAMGVNGTSGFIQLNAYHKKAGIYYALSVPFGTYDVYLVDATHTTGNVPTVVVSSTATTAKTAVKFLTDNATLAGQVTDAVTGHGISASINIYRYAQTSHARLYGVIYTVFTDSNGNYTLNVASGTYASIQVQSDHYLTKTVNKYVIAPGSATVGFSLSPA